MNKKIGLWILVAVVIIGGGYFVFKNSASLQKGVDTKSQTAYYNLGDKCTKMVDKEPEELDSKGNTVKVEVAGTYQWIYPSGMSMPYVDCVVGSSGIGGGVKFNENSKEFNINSIAFVDQKSEKNFLDWASQNSGVCIGTMDQARNDPYLQDTKNLGKFFSDLDTNKDNPTPPWQNASDSCYNSQSTDNPTGDLPTAQ